MKKILSIVISLFVLVVICASGGACSVAGTVNVKYYSSGTELVPALKQGALSYGVLPEPAATQLTKVASDKTWYRLDLQELYDEETKAYPQAVLMIKEELLATYPDIVSAFSESLLDGAVWAKNNVAQAVNAISSHLASGTPTFTVANTTAETIDGCKVYFESAAEAKFSVKKYIEEIIAVTDGDSAAPAVVPGDDFFYDDAAEGNFSADKITVFCPDGAPALSLAEFASGNSDLGTGLSVEYNIVSSNDIGGKMGTGDIVILPVNAATKLYKKGGSSYKMAAVLTHGNLYVMSTEKIEIEDLVDKTVGVIGQGLVPDLTFKAVLKARGISVEVA